MKPAKKTVERRRREKGIRLIDTGTRYDVVGRLKRLTRQIEAGEFGEVRGMGVVVHCVRGTQIFYEPLAFGMSSPSEFHHMMARTAETWR